MNTVELIQKEVKTLPAFKAQEVLDFIIFLKTKNENKEWKDMMKAQEKSLSNIWDNDEDGIWDNV